MKEKEPIKVKLSTILLIIALIVIIIMGVFIYYLMCVKENKGITPANSINNRETQTTENITEEVTENKVENNIDKSQTSENVTKSVETTSNGQLYDIKDAAKEYRLSKNIKNYKDFNYDLDGDGKIDKITMQYDKKLSKEYETDYYIFKLNGKQFAESFAKPQIYIVDLNENDKNMEVVLFDEGPSEDPNYSIYTKSGNKMKDNICILGLKFKLNKKGKFYVKNMLTEDITPEVYDKEYTINNGKISSKTTNVDKIKDTKFTTKNSYFTKDLKNLDKYLDYMDEENTDFETALKKANIREIDRETSFKIIKFTKDNTIYVELSSGEKGYIFTGYGHFVD